MLRCILIAKDGHLLLNHLVKFQAPILDHPFQHVSDPQHINCSVMGQGRSMECIGTVRSMQTPSSCNKGSFMLNVFNMCEDVDRAFSPYFQLKLNLSIFLYVFRMFTDVCHTSCTIGECGGSVPVTIQCVVLEKKKKF